MINELIKNQLRPLRKRVQLLVNYSYPSTGLNFPEYWKWHLQYSQQLLKFKNIHQGEGCFIIGNGPSLNKMDLSLLKNYYTFGLNKIYLIFEKVDLNLSYLVSVNPLVIEQSAEEFKKLSCPCFLDYIYGFDLISSYDHIYGIFRKGPYTFQTNLSEYTSFGYTVTYTAMQIAFYMGFKQVFLIGVDHNFPAAQGKPNQKQFLSGEDLNHFDPNYFANQEWQLPDLEGSELSYSMAKFHFNRSGREIYDATVDGKLQIFPKISYEQALNMCTNKF